MAVGLAIFLGCVAAIFGIIAVHECGHYLAGAAAGIPWNSMKIRLFTFPQHVALKAESRVCRRGRYYGRLLKIGRADSGERALPVRILPVQPPQWWWS